MFHTLGVRYLTLTHNGTTDWCDAALDEHRHGGLNSFGLSVIAEMNRLGMMIDISHASHDAMRQAARISGAPIIASHAAAYGVLPIDRNIPDDVIELVAGKGGLIMMHFCSGFLDARSAEACQRLESIERELRATYQRDEDYRKARSAYLATHPIPRSTIHTMIDHIDHIVRVAGIDHVGLGSDYDGMDTVPQGLEDVSCYPNITQVLLDRGYPEAEIRKILGENLLRVLREVTG